MFAEWPGLWYELTNGLYIKEEFGNVHLLFLYPSL